MTELSTIPISRLNNTELDTKIKTEIDKNGIDLSTITTNCITEIPQDIKLELTDGVLTLKAGSKVYVPNGFEADGTTPKFDKIIIENDLTTTQSANGEMSIFYASEDNALLTFYSSASESGTTTPAYSKSFYNIADNTVYRYNGGVKATKLSFALGLATVSSGALSSIDRVFNGFGYIGSTIFALPGVKGLAPNGRNADGSLNNVEWIINNVITRTLTNSGSNNVIALNPNEPKEGYLFGIISTSNFYYNLEENRNYNLGGNEEWQFTPIMLDVTLTSGVISNFNPKTTFQAVDRNELKQFELPTGSVIAFAANSAPDGYLICNGAAVNRTTYADLFAVIGTIYGSGDGSTTFNVPNLTDKFIQGSGTAGTSKAAGLPNITGTADVAQGASRSYNATGAFQQTNNGNGGNWDTSANCKLNINASRSSSIYGKSSTVQPPALTMRYYIKY